MGEGRTGTDVVFLPTQPIMFLYCNELFYHRLSQTRVCQQPRGQEPDEMVDAFGQKPLPRSLGKLSKASYLFEKPIFRDFTEIFPELVGVDSSVPNKLVTLGKSL